MLYQSDLVYEARSIPVSNNEPVVLGLDRLSLSSLPGKEVNLRFKQRGSIEEFCCIHFNIYESTRHLNS